MTIDGYVSAHALVGGAVCSPICFTDQCDKLVAVLDGEAVHQVERIRGLAVSGATVTVYLPERKRPHSR